MNTKNEVPFFARYLEGQDFPNIKTNLKAGEVPPPPEPEGNNTRSGGTFGTGNRFFY